MYRGAQSQGLRKASCEGRVLERVEIEYMCQINFFIHFV